jgi:phage terminase large subunit-like protein
MTPASWWGEGLAPHVRWPGVVRVIDASWDAAASRWTSDDGRFYFDTDSADRAEAFFTKFLRHPMGPLANTPFHLRDDQRYLVRALAGWKHAATGRRRFSIVFVAIPKGSGKSLFASGLALYFTFFDGEPGPEGHVVAGDRAQARIVFDGIKTLIAKHPRLAAHFSVLRDRISRRNDPTAYVQVLSSDAPTKHGLRPHVIAFDEFHVQRSRDLYDTLVRGLGKRAQPILLMITTAGDNRESVCYEEWQIALRVISGEIADDRYLPFVLALRNDEDWTDLKAIARVNPGYGVSMQSDYFAAEIAAAQVEPRKRNSFLKLHCNRWVSSATAWLPIEWWDACDAALPSDDVLRTLPVAAGLDMAQKIDLTAFVLVFRQRLDGPAIESEAVVGEKDATLTIAVSLNYRVIVLPMFWLPEETMRDHERDEAMPYTEWRDRGFLRVTPGAVIDYSRIVADIRAMVARFPNLARGLIGYDPAFATDIAQNLERAGLTAQEVLGNYAHMSEPCAVLEALVKAGRVVHGGHALLRQHVSTVAVKQDGVGRVMPVKPTNRSARQHIDGVVALLMGLKALATVQDQQPRYIYGIYPSVAAAR